MAVKLAQIIQPSQQVTDGDFVSGLDEALSVPLPPELEGKQGITIIDTMDTNPTVKFEEPGEYILGRYIGVRELHIESRLQKLYDLMTPQREIVSVWGSTILDNRMDNATKKGLNLNSSLMIQYLGDIDTGKGNPAKNFRVAWK